MTWTMADVAKWVSESGGIDTELGYSLGLHALEEALAEGKIDAENAPVAREFVRITLSRLAVIRELKQGIEGDERTIRDAQARIDERTVKRLELGLSLISVKAAQSQAESARKALRVSWLALFVALAAIALTAFDLATRTT